MWIEPKGFEDIHTRGNVGGPPPAGPVEVGAVRRRRDRGQGGAAAAGPRGRPAARWGEMTERAATDTNAGIVERPADPEQLAANGNGRREATARRTAPARSPARARASRPPRPTGSCSSSRGSRLLRPSAQDQLCDPVTLGPDEPVVIGVDPRLDDLRQGGRPVRELLVGDRGGESGAGCPPRCGARDVGRERRAGRLDAVRVLHRRDQHAGNVQRMDGVGDLHLHEPRVDVVLVLGLAVRRRRPCALHRASPVEPGSPCRGSRSRRSDPVARAPSPSATDPPSDHPTKTYGPSTPALAFASVQELEGIEVTSSIAAAVPPARSCRARLRGCRGRSSSSCRAVDELGLPIAHVAAAADLEEDRRRALADAAGLEGAPSASSRVSSSRPSAERPGGRGGWRRVVEGRGRRPRRRGRGPRVAAWPAAACPRPGAPAR